MAENGEHHSARPYFFVWVLLIALTATTWATGRMHLGTWALPLALAIAIAKSLLVILFFMHLWEQKGVNRIVIGTSFVFVALIISLTVADVAATRAITRAQMKGRSQPVVSGAAGRPGRAGRPATG